MDRSLCSFTGKIRVVLNCLLINPHFAFLVYSSKQQLILTISLKDNCLKPASEYVVMILSHQARRRNAVVCLSSCPWN